VVSREWFLAKGAEGQRGKGGLRPWRRVRGGGREKDGKWKRGIKNKQEKGWLFPA